MRIVINHLTRMQAGYVCVAGIDVTTSMRVRPTLLGRLPSNLLIRYGGLFDMANLVELGSVTYVGHAPEVEDHRFDPAQARRVGMMAPVPFWNLLKQHTHPTLTGIFGPDLKVLGPGCVVDIGRGKASLGCLAPAGQPQLRVNDKGQVRMTLEDGTFRPNLSVTDLRLYGSDHVTPDMAHINNVASRIRAGIPIILSVGLTQPYPPSDPKHWLQLNNVHLEDDPIWQLG